MPDERSRPKRRPATVHTGLSWFVARGLGSFCALAILLTPAYLTAQVVRLPAVEEPEQQPPGQLVSHPNSSSQILQAPGETDVAPATPQSNQPTLPPGVRNGFFQKALLDAAWLAPGGADGLGTNDVQLQAIFAMPCPTINSPLVLTPGFAVHYLQGPQNTELPAQLHEGWVDFRWLSQVTPQLGLDAAITPGLYSDFEQSSNKAFRLQGHAAAAWTCNPQTKLVLGAAYLDRPDIEAIPIGGIVWTPTEDVNFDLIFPHPKVSHRLHWSGQDDNTTQDWVYLAGEFNGDAWAVAGANGKAEQVILSDYRLVVGLERKVTGGLSSRVEVGYVFNRKIKYTGGEPDFHPTDTVMFRGGLTY